MNIKSDKIELFQDLSQIDFDSSNFDLHNDFDCSKVMFQNNILILVFQNIINKFLISISFQKTTVTFFEFDFTGAMKNLTIDNLYRGKYEIDGTLIEFKNNRGYYYLEFYEGQKIEFWSESISIERQ